ncbi:MAG: XdhC family protein [Woeseiaceae bacterium]|nr:XdhC family protein [Woeseiaceae bacterium]
MSTRQLLATFERWRTAGRDLVLATVYDTAGSTYSKAGAQMLIDADGNFQGMLSGGCLEGDLAERAQAVAAGAGPQSVTYDLRGRDEELWGLGVGCEGVMRIFLQPLPARDDFEPFAAMAAVYGGDAAGAAATVLATDGRGPAPGATLVVAGETTHAAGIGTDWHAALLPGMERARAEHRAYTTAVQRDGVTLDVLFARLAPPPHVLVLGAGLDAEPLVRLLAELGWRVTVQDHRPAYLERGDFSEAGRLLNLTPDELPAVLDLQRIDAAIVMSHHLQTDRRYLTMLADSSVPYVGLLGPLDRRRRLLAELGDVAGALAGRVHGPAGLDIGGRGPAAIALSIVAELHQQLVKEDRLRERDAADPQTA